MKTLNLSDAINENDEILFEEGLINVELFLSDNQYVELLSRSRMADKIIAAEGSIEQAVTGDCDCPATAYVNFYENGDVRLMLECNTSDGSGYYDDNIPLHDKEKELLLDNLRNVAKKEGTTVEEWFSQLIDEDDYEIVDTSRFIDLSHSWERYTDPGTPTLSLTVNRDAFEEIVRRASEQDGGEVLKECSIDELLGDTFGVLAIRDPETFKFIELRFVVQEQSVDVAIPLNEEETKRLIYALGGSEREEKQKERHYDRER